MTLTLQTFAKDKLHDPILMDFAELQRRIGFDDDHGVSSAYESSRRST